VSDVDERPEGGDQPSLPGPPVSQPTWSQPPPDDPPGREHGWVTPPAAVDGHAADGSWPAQPPAAVPDGEPPARSLDAPVAAAPPQHDHHPPHGQSRNPVDRLTRNLPHGMRVTIDWIVTIVGAIAIVLLVKAFVVNPYRIPSSSMEPTLHCARPEIGCEARYSDRVLANRFLYHLRDPRRGEIIVFKTPPEARLKCGAGGTFVKRLIGLPGDTVELRLRNGDGYVYINGKPLKEPYIQQSRRAAVQGYGPVKIKPGNYFMMGDNRSQSCDSRMWGTVPRANLIGKVFATYWPPNRISLH
jgi:signal peptidase I